MPKRKIVDAVADAVVEAEIGIVRSARQAVQAVNRRLGVRPRRKVTGTREAAKKSRTAASSTGRAVRKAARKRPVRKVARKATSKAARTQVGRRRR
jgi:hypothetical protein